MSQKRGGLPYRRRRVLVAMFLALAFVAGAAYDHYEVTRQNAQIGTAETLAAEDEQFILASKALGELAVKDRLPRTGYSRDMFSSGWASVQGCDMRNRILRRDLTDTQIADDGCVVLSGTLDDDPYTAKDIPFQRGKETSGDVQIDHVVAVSDAWQKGAQDLPAETRHAFYNDPLNLLAVDGPANMQKSDADAADWLPEKRYRCRYVARQIAVKAKYLLWVTKSELNAMTRVLQTCPTQVLPIVMEVESSE